MLLSHCVIVRKTIINEPNNAGSAVEEVDEAADEEADEEAATDDTDPRPPPPPPPAAQLSAQAPTTVTAQLPGRTRNTVIAGPIVPLCYC